MAKIKYTTCEGGKWVELEAHSVQFPNGLKWDEVNGMRQTKRRKIAVPIKLTANELAALATAWGYTLGEAADSWALALETVTRTRTS